MTIRAMKPVEYGALENFLYEAIYVPESTAPPPREIIKRPELQVYVKDFGTRRADICFVAEVDGQIVGACWSRIMNGKGIATALMKKLCQCLSEKNFKRVSLSVQKENSAAVALYRTLRFEVFDERGEEFLMVKRLEDA